MSIATFRLQGSVNLRALAAGRPSNPTIEEVGDLRRLRLPGIELQWRAEEADLATSERALVLATGQAFGAPSAKAWLERGARHGTAGAAAADGQFALVLIEPQAKRVTLLVDRFAMETLCYRYVPGELSFADTAADVPHSLRALDAAALYDYLYFHMIPSPRTVFQDVRRLEPAHFATADEERITTAPYWRPVFLEDDRRDLAGRLRTFREIVRASVEALAQDSEVACFLSGGTDSSTVAGMLTAIRGTPAHAYSIGFDAAGYDEMEYARIAARHFRLAHREYYVTPDDVVSAIPALAASFDQPFGNSSVLPAYYCALAAKKDGFARMLAGDGGDELFAGNSRYAWQQLFAAYHRLPQRLRTGVLEPLALRSPAFRRVPLLKQAGGYVRHARHPMPDRLETFQLLERLGHEDIFEPAFLAAVDRSAPLVQQRSHWNHCTAPSLVNRMLEYDWKYTLADNDLPKVRMGTRLAGTSVGYPLLSRALTDFSLAVPPEWKLRRLRLRWFYKEALRDFLPREILRKKKHGFGLPFGQWLVSHAPLRALAADSLRGIAEREIVRPQFVERLLDVYIREAPGYYGEMVWILTMLEQWLKAHEAASPGPKPFDRPPVNLLAPAAG